MSISSSGSWSREAAPANNIIDLDRFMRTARPERSRDRQLARNGQLIVDGGSLTRKPSCSSSASSEAQAPRRDKRFSHDSGLSDGSYARRRHRSHRRATTVDPAPRNPPARADSTTSMRAFRSACERALRDQQQAITRVAQICSRLAERERETTPTTSEGSSSSRSARDRRKDKRRTEECKTYKIIMTKLDELNRLFNARGRIPPSGRLDCHPDKRVAKLDSIQPANSRAKEVKRAKSTPSYVSVSDKFVATEPVPVAAMTSQGISRVSNPSKKLDQSSSRLVERAVGSESTRASMNSRHTRLAALRASNAADLDIAPRTPRGKCDCPNVLTESVVKCGSSNEDSSSCDPRCGFDLGNPVRLYAQAKRLQALHCAHSAGVPGGAAGAGGVSGSGGIGGGAGRGAWDGACRNCLRALRQCLTAPLCCPGWM